MNTIAFTYIINNGSLPVNGYEVVVRRGNDGRNVVVVGSFVLGVKKVVHDAAGDDALPVLLQEHIPRRVYQE